MLGVQLPRNITGAGYAVEGVPVEAAFVGQAYVCTSPGLVKPVNEDVIGGFTTNEGVVELAIADGHWLEHATDLAPAVAPHAVAHWLDRQRPFPRSRQAAVHELAAIENELVSEDLIRACGSLVTAETLPQTPEAAFLALKVDENELSVVSYGDCRLFVVRGGEVVLDVPPTQTWLGLCSALSERRKQSVGLRRSVSEAMIFTTQTLQSGDTVVACTDGLTECIYEQPTVSGQHVAELADIMIDPSTLANALIQQAFKFGAEDNIAVGVVRV